MYFSFETEMEIYFLTEMKFPLETEIYFPFETEMYFPFETEMEIWVNLPPPLHQVLCFKFKLNELT